ncbi:MAG: hypothetical protein K2N61_06500 [Lachnospiraceae bacterium]|nr:hypothetical protein [Lachnospiraceae bacterium]
MVRVTELISGGYDYKRYNKNYSTHSTVKKKDLLDYLLLETKNARLSFYRQNKDNPLLLLDAINFHIGVVDGGEGYFRFGEDGNGQIIPQYAIPRIDTKSLEKLHTDNNILCLSSNSYYSYTGKDGKEYACAFYNNKIHRAFSESILNDDANTVSVGCNRDMAKTLSVLTTLTDTTANGDIRHLRPSQKEYKEYLSNLGIKPGEFTIIVDGKSKVYYMGEDGSIRTQKNALELVRRYNKAIWLNNPKYSIGDEITVFGKKYKIDEDGHIHVPEEGFWHNEKCD